MITVDMRDRKPIYEQLVDNIRTLAVNGYLAPDEHLPSVRQLATELAINPNTIQKAYAELERQHIIYALPGRGNFISPDITAITMAEHKRLTDALRQAAQNAKNGGIQKDVAAALIEDVYLNS